MKNRPSIHRIIRSLHRDVGFLCIGLIIIYTLSGIVLIYRDTDFLKKEVQVEKKLEPGLKVEELGRALRIRHLEIRENDREIIRFYEGTYNIRSGVANYTTKELPLVLSKFIDLHKSASNDPSHWFTTLFGILLLFLAVSSFWMIKKGTRSFRRGIYFSLGGVLITIAIIII